jgi:hypothetical protein
MAGIIEFSCGDWYVSGGGFEAMGAGVMKHLRGNDAALAVKKELELAIASHLYGLDVRSDFTAEMVREFEKALKLYVSEVKSLGAESFANPVLFPGHLDRMAELQEKLAAS